MAAGDVAPASELASAEIDRSIRAAEALCRFEFSVFVGAVEGDSRAYAQRLHASLVAPGRSLMLLVDPRPASSRSSPAPRCAATSPTAEVELAVLQMESDFAAGDFVVASPAASRCSPSTRARRDPARRS